jgi:DNA-binding LytR/AlgR family response regulator
MPAVDRVLIRRADLRLVINPARVYYLEADGDETLVRRRGARALRDQRSLGEVLPAFERHGFLRVHDNHAVNLRFVREIRRRPRTRGWELKLQPPVNVVLPVARKRHQVLFRAYGG